MGYIYKKETLSGWKGFLFYKELMISNSINPVRS
jgi:hypothetical protein